MKTSHIFILLLSLISFLSAEKCHPNDKKALLKIKNDLNNPYDIITWDSKADCCEDWYGVQCDPKNNRITQLYINNADIKQPIPASIAELPYLEGLSFHSCNMTGHITQAIAKLPNLKSIDLRHNHLTGPVPSFLGQLKKLEYIGLSFNNLTGSIPASLFKLTKLGGLLLDRNKLTGTIPESFGSFKEDFYLYLSHNQLSGPIPKTLANANFNYIDASRNKLEGDISFLFGIKSLNYIDFSRNMLQFDFSKVVEFTTTLAHLDLNHNSIYGSIPQALAKIDYVSLDVSYNKLCGKIPVGGGLQKLDVTRFLHNKCLCGAPLPKCK
ncbi:hypothetical protein RD792_008024 [Penstemon davidsonii]|uniref:Leucine-rich repeat-containing N-terminal plant-type domain-containing protein n=1 Tax=Penstemon davidsonii TaxID=160366 RepID=A0ABR0D7V4_9LAMI|nr:hypothetical protein RD792_008024 [Penstemon davidsonii]